MPLSWNEIRERSVKFSQDWSDSSREKSDSQTFWNEFFNVFGVPRRIVASFEEPVKNIKGRYGYIDLFWAGKLIVEHKSAGKDLSKATSQALEYIQSLKNDGREKEAPKYIIVSDFRTIILYSLEPDEDDLPIQEISVNELHKHIHSFAFIPGYKVHKLKKEDPVNIEAAERMGRIHDVLFANGYSGHDLERFLVRTLFCLFAEDTGIFEPNAFTYFIENCTREDGSDLGRGIAEVFEVLNTPENKRQKNLDEILASMRYVNGGLFDEPLKMPACNREIRNSILAATKFDWSKISPAVFGSLFQSIMNPAERRTCGAHYTTEENILKVIRPLFLDDLRKEFEKCKSNKTKLAEFHRKLHSLTFFDPACGCGNFLVLAYRELRRLDMDVFAVLHKKSQKIFDASFVSQVDVDQFYGIEIVEFPVRIAETALWLMDHQMNIEASERFGNYYVRLPLQKSAKIVYGNALRMDWNDVVPKAKCSYILGNPPFVGGKYQNSEQREDLQLVFGKTPKSGLLDYVSCWFFKVAEYIQGTKIPVGLVSTNSITQGEQVGILWSLLFEKGIKINFAYTTFNWTSEAPGKSHVHCVIIGFSLEDTLIKRIFVQTEDDVVSEVVSQINRYLVAADDVPILNRSKPLCDVPQIGMGNQPIDNGLYLFSADEKREFVKIEPVSAPYFRKWVGSHELINGYHRWCLWLGDCPPNQLRQMPECMKRVEAVRKFRLASKSPATQQLSKKPTRFNFENMPNCRYLAIPEVSSERRDYIPMMFLSPKVCASNLLRIIPGAKLYHFGILTSAMHMTWMRRVCGRLESRYRYSAKIVYNNFPWPDITESQRTKIETLAGAVLEVRERYPDSSLADLYDPLSMPSDLLRAHQELDRAVDLAYRKKPFSSDEDRLSFLFGLYEKLTMTPFSTKTG